MKLMVKDGILIFSRIRLEWKFFIPFKLSNNKTIQRSTLEIHRLHDFCYLLKDIETHYFSLLMYACITGNINEKLKSKIFNYFLGIWIHKHFFGTWGIQSTCLNHYNTYLMWKTYLGKLSLLDFQRIFHYMVCLKENCTKMTI